MSVAASQIVLRAPPAVEERSESNEGRNPRRSWDVYAAAVNKTVTPKMAPIIEAAVAPIARTMLADMIGFWTLWHLHGGTSWIADLAGAVLQTTHRHQPQPGFRCTSQMIDSSSTSCAPELAVHSSENSRMLYWSPSAGSSV